MAFRRAFSNTLAAQSKVCVVGGAGGIGQPLSLLLKQNSLVSHVAVFDMVGAPGVAADLSHINTPAKVTGHGMSLTEFKGDGDGNGKVEDQAAFQAAAFDDALQGCDVVVIPAGVPRKPGMTRQDLFEVNASLNKASPKPSPRTALRLLLPSFPTRSTLLFQSSQSK
jgi:malate dehydrogenase